MEHPDQADKAQPEPKPAATPDSKPPADKPDDDPKPPAVTDPFDV